MQSPQEIPRDRLLKMWLDDPVTIELLAYLENQIRSKLSLAISTRRVNPSQLPDVIAELELATALKSTVVNGKFLSS